MADTIKGLTYAEWMKRVNAKLESLTGGMNADDLPDYCYMDCWRAGDSPVATAKEAFKYAQDY